MPYSPSRPTPLSGRVFRGTDAVHRGLLTSDQLRSEAWVRVRQDVYADARMPRDHGLACAAASARLPPSTVFAGRSAAYLLGVPHAATYKDEVHVITPTDVRLGRQLRLAVHHMNLAPDEVTDVGLPVTGPTRTAWDVAKWHDPVDYDGAGHAGIDQLHRDRWRLNQLAAAGWTVPHVTSRRLAADFPAVLTEVRTALYNNGYRP